MGRDWPSQMRRTNLLQGQHHWIRLPQGYIKCNTDRSFLNEGIHGTAGWVLRDSEGNYKGCVQAIGRKVQKPRESGDNRKAIDILKDKMLCIGVYNWTKEIKCWTNKFEAISFQWTKKEANKVADRVATSRPIDRSFTFHITNLLHEDHVSSIA